MKHLFLLLFFLPLVALGQQLNRDQWGNQLYIVPVWEGWCEYLNTYIRSSDSTWWAGGNDIALRGLGSATASQAVPTEVPVSGKKFIQISNGLHDNFAISSIADTSFGYEIGANNYGQRGDGTTTTQTTAYKLRYDSTGNLFDSLKIIAGGWQAANNAPFYAAVKNNGSVWMWGDLTSGGAGNQSAGGTLKKPISVTLAGGKTAVYIQCNDDCAVLCSDSTVQTWGNDNSYPANLGRTYSGTGNRSPADIGLSHIVMISVGYGFNYAVDRSGNVWFWGEYGSYGGYGITTYDPVATPINITSSLGLPATIKKIVCNHNATEALLANGQVWSWGGIPSGSTGQGKDFNWPIYTTPASGTNPYNGTAPSPWNWYLEYFNANSGDYGDYTLSATQVAPGKSNFVQVFGGQLYDFDFACEDSTGQFYQAGRNKGAVIANGTFAADTLNTTIEADFPVSWDQIYLVLTNPFNVTVVQEVTSPYCVLNPSTAPCSDYAIPTRTHPHASVTSFTTAPGQVILNGTASTAYYFNNRLWTQLTGPATAKMAIQTSPTDTLNLTTTGTYTFQYKITDDVWQSDSATATIIVSATIPTGSYFATAGTGTACTHSSPCPTSYIPTVTPLLLPGDSIYLNRGDAFPLDMLISVSGSAGNDIVLTAYGSGADPILGGMTTLTSPTNTSGNLWSWSLSGPTPRLLTINGALAGKSGTANSYSTFIPASGSTTDLHFASNPFNVGDSIVIKSSGYTFDFAVVSASTSTDATISPALYCNTCGGTGAFKIGGTPTTQGAWNLPSAGIVQAYSVGAPTGYAVPNVGIPLTLSGSYIKVTGIAIKGADTVCINLSGAHDVIDHDSLQYGVDWIWTTSAVSDTVTNNYIANFGNGMRKTNFANYKNVWEGNTILNCGMIPGMGTPGGTLQNYCGLITGDSAGIAKFNLVDSTGYIGIAYYGSSTVTDSNNIRFACQQLPDGGGTYTYVSTNTTFPVKRKTMYNLIHRVGGSQTLLGTSLTAESNGIYDDNWTSQDSVLYNSIDSVQGFSIYDHGPANVYEYNNTYAAAVAEFFIGEVNALTVTSIVAKYNQFCASNQGALPIWIYSQSHNDLSSFGVIDSTSYFSYRQLVGGWKTQSSVDPGTSRGIAGWQSATPYDPSSLWFSGQTQYLTGGMTGQTYTLTGLWADASGNTYSGTISLPAYQSKILIRKDLSYITAPRRRKILVP